MKKYLLFSLLVIATFTLSACGTNTDQAANQSAALDQETVPASQSNDQLGGEKINKDEIKKELSGISVAEESSSQTTGKLKYNMIKVDQSKFENLIAKYSQAIFKTNQGSFTIKFYGDKAPETVNNFMNLAKLGYYDGVKFHRVIANFMIQGGDQNTKDDSLMNSWGMGGPGYTIKDEFGVGLSNIPGTISMANAGPGTGGSQFFINVNNNSYLDGKHAVFGEVSEGAEVVAAISKSSVDSSDRPTSPVVIESITLK